MLTLLEDLAVSPLIGLPIDLDGLIPSPHIVDEFLILGGIKLGELVAVYIWSNIESRVSLLAADHEGTLDDRVVSHTVD